VLEAWFHEAIRADWKVQADVLKAYTNASIVGPDRVTFNVKGNDCRLVVAINNRHQIVFIKWIGTHGDYDKIDVKAVKYGHQAHLEGKPIASGHCARWRSCGVLPRVRQSDESDILAILIGAQELADPIEAIKFRLEVTFRFLRLTNCSTTPVFVTATARVISGRRHRWAAYRSSKRPHSPSSMRQRFSSQARSRPEYRRRTTCRPS
jgi:mRNA interferase HigB